MVYGAIDLHMRYSQIRIVDGEGQVVREQRVPTRAERLVQAFAGHGPKRVLLETGTESEASSSPAGSNISWQTTSGRLTLSRRANIPPTTAPADSTARIVPQAPAPPSSSFATSGPSTNRAGK